MEASDGKKAVTVELLTGDAGFAEEVMAAPGGETLSLCYQCGTCTGCCPVSAVDEEFSPARIIQWIRLGLRPHVLASSKIWLCLRCHRCSFYCPQGVRFADINAALAYMAVRDGFVSEVKADRLRALEGRLAAVRCALIERALNIPDGETIDMDAWLQDVLRDLHG
ncbi:4Fe-4S dicluster domain-containing protein [Desulfosoma caldarium]|uniref:Heterodisulfide reductase subunit C n=1 Tax=Desulfosoma caldarium TaxID=610254 RepID=A0A3N1URF0_9BACT|nr:4Fe-4S dicluster domain-containing protein [Desulfosoma caldarium]ROQ92308.1 heterodisulfide reductase subunit C [Desulfosoma caldarium]